jgi:hypothetical protein
VSTILKALKRLDEQRRADSLPKTLEEQLLASGARSADPAARRNKWLLATGGALLGLSLVAGGWIYARSDKRLELAAAAPPAPAASAPPPAAAAPQPSPRVASPAPPIYEAPRAEPEVPSARIEEAAPSRQPQGAEPAAALAATSALSAVAAEPRRDPAAQLPSQAALARRAPASAPEHSEDTAPQEPQSQIARPAARDSGAERETEMRTARADDETGAPAPSLPGLRVERTQWHPNPEKRSALVAVGESGETQELHEGDALDGAVVKEIRPSGVLFVRDGVEFKRGVGGR